MSYVSLEQIKKHLQIDEWYIDDDVYLETLSAVAEDAVAKHIDIELENLVVDGELPSAIKQSILLLVGNLYANREPVVFGASVIKIPYTYEYLLGLYKHYHIP